MQKGILFLIVLFFIAVIRIQADGSSVDFSSLRRTIKDELDEKFTPGAAVALIQNNRIIFSEGVGFANEEKKTPEAEFGKFARTLKSDSILADPGMAFSYSNLNYAIAGLVIQGIDGKPYADVMSERLFKPLGMDRTTFRPAQQKLPIATGYIGTKPGSVKEVPLANDTRLWPAGYAFSTLNDLSRFAIALLNQGKLEGKQVIASAVIKKIMDPSVSIPTNVFENGKYGYGFFIHDQNGSTIKEHGGNMPGYIAELVLQPDKRIALIVLLNSGNDRFTKTIDAAFSLLLPNVEKEKKKKLSAFMPMGEAEMSRYVGTYKNRWDMDIFIRDKQLFLRRFGDELPITKVGDNRFAVFPPGAVMPQEFLLLPGKDGKPQYIQMFLWIFKRTN